MVAAMIYDTLKLAEQLERKAGFDAARARAIAHIPAENSGGTVTTREDLLVTKAVLEAAIQTVDARVSGLRSDMRVLSWMVGTTLAGVATLLGTAITVALHIMRLG